ncbi:MAG TPA: TRAP transporter substrate-binding protein DctP [Nitrospirota bacterium]|nr:TRAP transporter substrate-binding protein DctP [Nitrospirota bacterium]
MNYTREGCTIIWRWTIVCLTALLMTIGVSYEAKAADKVYKWRMQSLDPPANPGPQITVPRFIKNVKEMSGGRIDITLYTAAQLVPTVEMVNALSKGTLEMAHSWTGNYVGKIPEGYLNTTMLPPMLFDKQEDVTELYFYRGLDNIMREAYAENGVYLLNSVFGGPVNFWSRKPMNRVADLKGFKVRSFGYAAKTFEKLGAAPVFMPHEEVYAALAQGVIDGSMTDGTYYEKLKYYEVAKYYYLPPWFEYGGITMMVSLPVWKELPDDLKAILTAAGRIFADDHYQTLWGMYDETVAKLKAKYGTTLITWPKEDVRRVREVAMTFFPEIAAKSPRTAKGIKIIEDYLKAKGQ